MVAFLSGAVLTAANLNSAFNALTFRAVTGTSDTFVLADNGGRSATRTPARSLPRCRLSPTSLTRTGP